MARLEGLEPPTYRFEVALSHRINSLHGGILKEIRCDICSIHAGLMRVVSPLVSHSRGMGWLQVVVTGIRPILVQLCQLCLAIFQRPPGTPLLLLKKLVPIGPRENINF